MPLLTPCLCVWVAVSQPFNQRLKGKEIARRPGIFIRQRSLGWHCGRDEDQMNRRDFVRLGWATVIGAGAGKLRPAFAESLALRTFRCRHSIR